MFDLDRAMGEWNVAEDLRRGRGVLAIIVSTSGLSGRLSAGRARGEFVVRVDIVLV